MNCRYIGGLNNKTHGKKGTRIHRIWSGMKARCTRKNHPSYADYGGRNITVYPEWVADFLAFEKLALSNGYADSLTLERKDNDAGYNPGNCEWADLRTQSRNRRNMKRYYFNGKMLLLCELSEVAGINRKTISQRIESGWSMVDAATIKPSPYPPRKNACQTHHTLN